MELWYTEQHSDDVRFSLRVERQLYSGRSAFQDIAVYHSKEFGNFLTLDGYLMITEKDEFVYHEMITHVPLSVNPDVRNVLVIGAGDGGTVRELVRYAGIARIDMVEIDREVVSVCREYFPNVASGLDDPRVRIYYEDGLKFVRSRQNEYDLVIVDSTDPFGPGEGLFTKEFYGNCENALTDRGILVNQHESVFYREYAESMRRAHRILDGIFPICRVYQAHIPTYPSGHWLFGFSSKGPDPLADFDAARWSRLGIATRYYNTDLHRGCFALPNSVKEQLKIDDGRVRNGG
ncbi:MAG: polyamine aminopropyltransferase [Clostridiales bacterium]|jgi:spermidine synthase|nr:polyamine aminopropyltransferase [Clostridiales bacterium]